MCILKRSIFSLLTLTVTLWGYHLDYWLSKFTFYECSGYDRIKAADFTHMGNPGAPELPAVYLHYMVPCNAEIESLVVLQSSVKEIPGNFFLYPAQPSHAPGESIKWVPPDSLIYNSNEVYPGDFIRLNYEGVMDGARIVTIEVRPIQYRPKSQRLYLVEDIDFNFVFSPSNPPEVQSRIRGKCEQGVFDAVLRNTIENDYEIPLLYNPPTLVEENQVGTLSPIPGAPGVIITTAIFFNAFQDYADWMTDQGVRTIMITPEYIYSAFPNGRDNAEKIRLYIKWCYEHAGGTYFLLGGDDNRVPVRYCWSIYSEPPPDSNWSVPCDMYFSDLTGEWDDDNDGKWGERDNNEGDRFPEVFVGRVTAYCIDEVNNWVDKVMDYEKSPDLIDSFALWLYKDMNLGDAYTVFPDYFDGHHFFIEMNNAQEAVQNHLSQGYAFNSMHCHGVRKYFCDFVATTKAHAYWPGLPSPFDDGLNNILNYNKHIFSYSLACHNGGFDAHWINPGTPNAIAPTDTCVADGFTDAYIEPIGACAFMGNTRATRLSNSYNLEYEFYSCLFSPYIGSYPPEPAVTRFGITEALSKCGGRIDWMLDADRHNCYTHNCFGSPYTEAWTNQPRSFLVAHMRRIFVGIQYQFRVTVRDAVSYANVIHAKVCLHKPDDLFEVGYTDEDGRATFNITASSPGEIKITVTRIHDNNTYIQYFPSETYCLVNDVFGGDGSQQRESMQILPDKLCISEMVPHVKNNLHIQFGIPEKGDVLISLYDATGAQVKNITKQNLTPGYYHEKVNVDNLACGVYFIRIKQGNERMSKKFVHIK